MQELFNKNIFVYIMLSLCICGVLLKFVLDMIYSRLMKASDNMGTAKNKLTQTMKKKFETCYKLKIGVNNVDIFVDKYVYRHKFCGILLSTWENIGGQILMLCLLIGSISAVLGLIYECGKQEILSTFSVGILTSGLLIFLEGMMNLSGKKELIRLNMKDYLENFFKVRLEQELFHPELMEQYKKEFLIQEEREQGMNSTALIAATTENIGKKDKQEKKEKQDRQAAVKAKKNIVKKQHIKAVRLEKDRKKAETKVAKVNEKAEKKFAIEKNQESIERKRVEARNAEERIKKEAKLAINKKREEVKLEIELKKSEAKAEEIEKQEEKHRQDEIKKVLLLEKQITKEEKQKKTDEHKTIAQERKENLKREFQQRRSLELQEAAKPLDKLIIEENQFAEVAATVEKVQVRPVQIKKVKQSNSSEDKLIEDILKEFLA